jgi:arginase
MRRIAIVGVASGQAGQQGGCWRGPLVLRNSLGLKRYCAAQGLQLVWHALLQADERAAKLEAVTGLCRQVARFASALVRQHRPFLFLGGDHATAMGVWQGVMGALPESHRLGLIWIDAHMDAHTFETTPSGNVHGMPVAGLLGQGDRLLTRVYGGTRHLQPENLVLLGVRSYEPAEQRLLERLGVRVIGMPELNEPGALRSRLVETAAHLSRQVDVLGISIDLDAVDPRDAPAVGVPEPGGIAGDELVAALAAIAGAPRLVGMEIAEFCPRHEREEKTVQLIGRLIAALYGEGGEIRTLYRSFGSAGEGIKSTSAPISRSQAS